MKSLVESLRENSAYTINEEFSSPEEFCKKYNIKKYEIVDGKISPIGRLFLEKFDGTEFPFEIISDRCDELIISGCPKLKSFKNLPDKIDSFSIYDCNSITSLIGIPNADVELMIVGCPKLKSLEGFPGDNIGILRVFRCGIVNLGFEGVRVGRFELSDCPKLKSLKGFPNAIWDYTVQECPNLTSLAGVPEKIKGGVVLRDLPKLKSLDGATKECVWMRWIGGDKQFSENEIKAATHTSHGIDFKY